MGVQGLNTVLSLISNATGRTVRVTGQSSVKCPHIRDDVGSLGSWIPMAVLKGVGILLLATLPTG